MKKETIKPFRLLMSGDDISTLTMPNDFAGQPSMLVNVMGTQKSLSLVMEICKMFAVAGHSCCPDIYDPYITKDDRFYNNYKKSAQERIEMADMLYIVEEDIEPIKEELDYAKSLGKRVVCMVGGEN